MNAATFVPQPDASLGVAVLQVWRQSRSYFTNAPGGRAPPSQCAARSAEQPPTVDCATKLAMVKIEVTRRQIEKAIERNVPFILKMADGNEYRVPHRDYIVFPPRAAYVIVFDETDPQDAFDVLPLLTMTSLHQAGDGAQGS